MTVQRSDGTIVPFMPIRDSGQINSYWMNYDKFAELPEVFCQRNTEGRLTKAQKHLSKLLTEHCVVFLAKLTEPDELKGKKYPAGYRFRIDSNTRAMNWSRGGSDSIPNEVFVIEYSFKSLARIRESYDTFDSVDSVERNQEKIYGVLYGMYSYQPVSHKLIQGAILSGLNKACHFYFPETWNQYNVKAAEIPGQVGAFLNEIKAFDQICSNSGAWDQALVCTALMTLKKYGCDNQKLIEALSFINQRAAGSRRTKDWDGVTHIVYEWETGNMWKDKTTIWYKDGGLNNTVSFACYWMDKYMKDQTGTKPGGDWKQTAFKYKDQKVSPNLHQIFSTPVAA